MTKISIIMPAYNAEEYIKKSIDSILQQTYENFELIIVNDGSKDNTAKIINEYSDKRINYFYKENGGPAAARNYALDKATGDYISFVDSDDYLDPQMLEKMINKITRENADIVVCDYYIVKNGNLLLKKVGLENDFNCNLSTNPKLLNIVEPAPWNKIYSKKMFESEKNRFPLGLKYEDFGLIPILLYEANKIVKIDEPLYYYIENTSGETAIVNDKIFDILKIFEILITYFNKTNDKNIMIQLENVIVSKAMMYNMKSFSLSNQKKTVKFLNDSYALLNDNFPNWKKNGYFNLNKKSIYHNFLLKHKTLLIYYKLMFRR